MKVSEESRFRIPLTTKREVFAHYLEDGTEVVGNGTFIIPLDYMSSFDISVMLSELKEFINISNVRQGCSRQVNSSWDNNENEFKGILVTLPVLCALEQGGSIQTEILQTYGLTLHIVKSNESLPENGFIRLASISW